MLYTMCLNFVVVPLTACCSLFTNYVLIDCLHKENLLPTFYRGSLTATSEAFAIFPTTSWILKIFLGALIIKPAIENTSFLCIRLKNVVKQQK